MKIEPVKKEESENPWGGVLFAIAILFLMFVGFSMMAWLAVLAFG